MKTKSKKDISEDHFIEELNLKQEKRTVNLVSGKVIFVSVFMLIINIINENLLLSLISSSYIIIGLVALLYYNKARNFDHWTTFFLVFTLLVMVMLFYNGGTKGAGILWVFFFPSLAFHYKPYRQAVIYSSILFVTLLFLFVVSPAHFYPSHYDPLFMTIYLLIFVGIVGFLFAESKRREINNKLLKESKDRFYTLFNHLSMGVALIDSNMHVIEANQTLRKWYPKLQKNEGALCYECMGDTPKTEVCSDCQVHKAMADGKVHTIEKNRMLGNKNGFVRITASPIFNEQRKIVAVIETIEDVSDHETIKQALRSSDKIFSQALDMLFILGFDGHFKTLNPSWERLLGWSKHDLMTRAFFDHVHPEDKELTRNILQIHKEGQADLAFENRFLCKDGSVKWLSWKSLSDQKDQIIYGVVRDITEEKNAAIRLKKSEQRLNDLISNLPGFVYNCANDPLWTVDFISDNCEELTGYSPSDLIHNKTIAFGDLIHPDDRKNVWDIWQKALESNTFFEGEYRINHADGSVRWFFERGKGIYDETGQLLYLQGFISEITASKAAEIALRESELKFRILSKSASAGIYMYRNDHFIMANPAVTLITGYEEEDLLSKSLEDVVHPDNVEKVKAVNKARLANEDITNRYELRILKADGSTIWIDHSADIVMVDQQPTVIGTFFDITEMRLASEALRRSDERYRLITGNTSDVIWILNLNKEKFTYISPSIFQLRGYTPEEALLESLEEALTPQSAVFVKAQLEDKLKEFLLTNDSKASQQITEIQQPCKDGRIITVEVATHIQINKSGDLEIIGVSRNIDDRKRMEAEISFNASFQKLIADISKSFIQMDSTKIDQVMIEALQKCGRFLNVDRTFMFHFSSDLKGMTNSHEWCAENVESFKDSLQDIQLDSFKSLSKIVHERRQFYLHDIADISENSSEEKTLFKLRKTKSLLVMPLMKDNVLLGYLGFETVFEHKKIEPNQLDLLQVLANIFSDVWMKLRLDAILNDYTTKLAVSNETKDRLFSIIAHDLRSPFTSFIGLSELMAEDEVFDTMEEMRQHAAQLHLLALSTYDLLDNLLQWSRLQGGEIVPVVQTNQVHEFINKMVAVLLPQIEQKYLRFFNQVPIGLVASFDPNMIEIVVRNLLSNAMKFTHSGGKIWIEAEIGKDGNFILRVLDSGIGIPSAIVNELFSASNQKGRIGLHGERSSGLGLMLCKEFVEKHHGTISVESVENKGSTFIIQLPQKNDTSLN